MHYFTGRKIEFAERKLEYLFARLVSAGLLACDYAVGF